jgi:hypothetical protein
MSSTNGKDETVVLFVQVEKQYETYRVTGRVHLRQPNGEMHSATWDYGYGTAAEYDGFAAHAYLGAGWSSGVTPEDEKGVWGMGFSYSPFRIDNAKQAKAIARVMERLERGLDKLNDDEGNLGQEDFAGYLVRIARVLKIKEIWVRRTERQRNLTGELYQLANGSKLQYWVQEVDQAARTGKRGELIRS